MNQHKTDKLFLGIGKTKFNSSVCLIDEENQTTQIWLSERLSRKKSSGEWPHKALLLAEEKIAKRNVVRAENRDFTSPEKFEDFYNTQFPFYEFIEKNQLDKNVKRFNAELQSESHHEAHAYAALAMSPFLKSIIVVWDGAGSATLKENHYEEYTVYLQDLGVLTKVESRSAEFILSKKISSSVGLFFEKISEFIFNSSTSAGKVMGLAPFGQPLKIGNRVEFQENLDWKKSFKGKTKEEWESSIHYSYYCDLAATAQAELEKEYLKLLLWLREKYDLYENLILVGGCALNCTNNAKILNSKIYKKIYIPPFPGDECIGFGLANLLRLKMNPEKWKQLNYGEQISYFGPIDNLISSREIEKKLHQKNVHYAHCNDVIQSASTDLINKKIIAWYQGRSECGPRALGNRSILARTDIENLKNYLNYNIKFRENFRPYGSSILFEYVEKYFEVPNEFENPFMSFAVKTKAEYLEKLKEVTHIDQTSRMQTVHQNQNELLYKLIKAVGDQTQIYCLLNTSLNIMGQPIVETVDDAIDFFLKSNIEIMYIGEYRLSR